MLPSVCGRTYATYFSQFSQVFCRLDYRLTLVKLILVNRVLAGLLCALSVVMVGCSQPTTNQQINNETNNQPANNQDSLQGCYTVSHTEPAQIKISHNGDGYVMQMRQFNDPTKAWDKPEALQLLATDSPEIQRYFDIKADDSKYLEKVIARPDRVFVLAKLTDGFANLNPQFDSPYLGFIYKGSNTIYKVDCEPTSKL